MLDPVIAAGMIFALLMVLLIGGFIVLFPVTSRLGKALETYLEARKEEGGNPEEVVRLRRELRALRERVESMTEKQAFVEELLQERRGGALPGGTSEEDPEQA